MLASLLKAAPTRGEPLGMVADLRGDLHRAEFRAANGAEMGDVVGLFGEVLVVRVAGGFSCRPSRRLKSDGYE